MWNSINHDCFGRLDTTFDKNNSNYRAGSKGIYSGTFLPQGKPPAPVRVLAPAERTPPPPPFGNLSNTNVWGKQLSNGSFALLFLNVGAAPSPPLACDARCVAKVFAGPGGAPARSTPAPGARYAVRDLWSKRRLPGVVAPFTVSSPPLGEADVLMLRFDPE